MDDVEAAYKILRVLKGKKQIITLASLAKTSGFERVNNIAFKRGFNLLQRKGAVQLRQSGWPSEIRGVANNHPKTVLLISDVYEIQDTEQELKEELNIGESNIGIPKSKNGDLVPIYSVFKDQSFINKTDYERDVKERHGYNFWKPIKTQAVCKP